MRAVGFYGDFLGLDVVMDLAWMVAYASPANPTAQVTSQPAIP